MRSMVRQWVLIVAMAATLMAAACSGAAPDPPSTQTQEPEEPYTPSDNTQEHIHQALAYLESVRDESIGLLYESPDGMQTIEGSSWQLNQVYWAQTDNFLAALALRPYNRALSDSIQTRIAGYQVPSASKPNAITVLDGRIIPDGAAAVRTVIEATGDDYVIVTEVQDGVDISDWEMYGNLLALQSLNEWLRGNEREALRLYYSLLGMWDGHGINDKATREDGQYAVYKIALTLLLSKVYEEDLSEAAAMEDVMWSAQAESGGIRTDLDASTFAVGGYTNTETTSLVILAYDRALIQSLRSAGLQAQQ